MAGSAPQPGAEQLHLEVPAAHSAGRMAREVLGEFGRREGLAGEELSTLEFVASELLTNAVDHGGGGAAMEEEDLAGEVRITIHLRVLETSWELRVADQGGGNPESVAHYLDPTWLFEVEVGAWFFGDNDDFLGQTRAQDPLLSTEFHLVKQIRPGFWASLDANFYVGGRTRIDNQERGDFQRNSRAGATVVFPMKGRHALRSSYSTGVVTESGGDFEIFTLSYLYAW